jgi:hypothetical protein
MAINVLGRRVDVFVAPPLKLNQENPLDGGDLCSALSFSIEGGSNIFFRASTSDSLFNQSVDYLIE